jgi:hypothetical protein
VSAVGIAALAVTTADAAVMVVVTAKVSVITVGITVLTGSKQQQRLMLLQQLE